VHRYCQMMLARAVTEAEVVEMPKEVPRVGRVRRRAAGQQRILSKT
jgi:hypothetical protein